MPKMKTKSGTKKRFRVTGSGKIKFGAAYKRHGMSKRPQKMKRQSRGTQIMNESDRKLVMEYMPYARVR
jgi:large subunit ribosomal protein L35